MGELIESFVIMQSIILGINLQLDRFYDRNDHYIIKYNKRTICAFYLYDIKAEENFYNSHKVLFPNVVKKVKYDCKFEFHENIFNKHHYFNNLIELEKFLNTFDIKELISNLPIYE